MVMVMVMAMAMVTPAAAEEHDGGGDPDEDEDGRAHPDANHCLDRQHLGVRMKKMILSDKRMADSGSLTLCLYNDIIRCYHIFSRNIFIINSQEGTFSTWGASSTDLFSCVFC